MFAKERVIAFSLLHRQLSDTCTSGVRVTYTHDEGRATTRRVYQSYYHLKCLV